MTIPRTLSTLNEVITRWPDLTESRFHGTPRPWRHGELNDDAKAARDHQARIERAEADRLGRAPGYSAAPLHVDVLDTMATIVMTADTLHEHVAQTIGRDRLPTSEAVDDDPRPHLRYITEHLREACDTDPDMLDAATEKADLMRSVILISLGEVFDGQTLNAICPFCVGRTYRRPAGERTLRIRVIPDVRATADDGATELVILCENPDGCVPFSTECGLWVKGRPGWYWSEWEWLANRLLPARAA